MRSTGVLALRACVALLLPLLGCGGGTATTPLPPADTQPPTFSAAEVSPSQIPFSGGTVTITARVADASGVSRVWAEVTMPGFLGTTLELASTEGGNWSAQWTVPPNRDPTAPATYTLVLRARDVHENVAVAESLSLQVLAAPAPPAAPVF
ncbi:MAG: Ig-like domain-containing protein [Armatimonadota bacterium]|nr:Ig-like domain-containing protein [Armatimonadota bacterium]